MSYEIEDIFTSIFGISFKIFFDIIFEKLTILRLKNKTKKPI